MFRKIIASLIFVLFVVSSVPFFLGLTLGKSFFSRSFYTGVFLDTAYSPLMSALAGHVGDLDPAFKNSISEDEVHQSLEKYFTKPILTHLIDDSFQRFDARLASLPSTTDTAKLQFPVSLAALVDPAKHFFQDIIQHAAPGKIPAEFEKGYDDMILKKFGGPHHDFSYDLDLGISQNNYISLVQTFDTTFSRIPLFLLAFTLLMLLLWRRPWSTGLRWSGRMWLTSAILGGIFAVFLFFIPNHIPPSAFGIASQDSPLYLQVISLLHIFISAFLKIYILVLSFAFLIAISFYFFARKFK